MPKRCIIIAQILGTILLFIHEAASSSYILRHFVAFPHQSQGRIYVLACPPSKTFLYLPYARAIPSNTPLPISRRASCIKYIKSVQCTAHSFMFCVGLFRLRNWQCFYFFASVAFRLSALVRDTSSISTDLPSNSGFKVWSVSETLKFCTFPTLFGLSP